MSVCSGEYQIRLMCGGVVLDEWWDDSEHGQSMLHGGDIIHKPGGRCPKGAHTVEVRSFGPWLPAPLHEGAQR